jgi:hypothetical protein
VPVLAAGDDDLIARLAAHDHGVARARLAVDPVALRRGVLGEIDLAIEDIQLAHGHAS